MRFRTASSAFFFLFATLIAATPASASCSNATLNGNWGYFHGRPTGSDVYRVVGHFSADGVGNLNGAWTLALSGTVSTGTFTGSYSIAKNCTGTFTFSFEDQSPVHFNIVFDEGNQGFQMIQTDSGFDQPGFGVFQGTVPCALSGKPQIFATNFLGVVYPSDDIEAAVGRLTLNGKGALSGTETFSVHGAISTLPVAGTYTENADCTGTMKIVAKGNPATNFNTVIVDGGSKLLLLETDNNTYFGGTAEQ